jgi:hypothetical protein
VVALEKKSTDIEAWNGPLKKAETCSLSIMDSRQ